MKSMKKFKCCEVVMAFCVTVVPVCIILCYMCDIYQQISDSKAFLGSKNQ